MAEQLGLEPSWLRKNRERYFIDGKHYVVVVRGVGGTKHLAWQPEATAARVEQLKAQQGGQV
ncbi:MAG: Uncharacterised protein [Synechococcus sp. CC9902]|nr:MAG: Uncharacterised protein [Synechococcus sp. CC9902]